MVVLQFGRLILEDYYRSYNFPLDITFRAANCVSELSGMSRPGCTLVYPKYNRDVSIDIINFVHYSLFMLVILFINYTSILIEFIAPLT